MSVETNIALMRRWYDDIWNNGKLATIHELMAPNAICVGQSERGETLTGADDFAVFAQRILATFSDMHLTIDDIFGVGDRVVARWSGTMTHTGDELGIPATHRRVQCNGISIAQFRDGRIIAGWDCWDQAGLMKQLTTGTSKAAA